MSHPPANSDDFYARVGQLHELGLRAFHDNQLGLAENAFRTIVLTAQEFVGTEAPSDVLEVYGVSLLNLAETLRRMSAHPEMEEP